MIMMMMMIIYLTPLCYNERYSRICVQYIVKYTESNKNNITKKI